MALTPSSIKRAIDGTGRDIKTFDDGSGKHIQAIAVVDDSGVQVGVATNPLRVDPTGSTTQPVSGTVNADKGTGWSGVGVAVENVVPVSQNGTWDIGTLTSITDNVNIGDISAGIQSNDVKVTLDSEVVAVSQNGTWSVSIQEPLTVDDGGLSLTIDHSKLDALTVTGGDLEVKVDNTVTVTATALDIRALSHGTDSVKIGDGTEFASVNLSNQLETAEANSAAILTAAQAIQTAVQIMDDWDDTNQCKVKLTDSSIVDGTYIGDIKFGESLPAGVNNIGDVDVATLPGTVEADITAIKTAVEIIDNAISGSEMQVDIVASLPAGDNNIGNVDIVTLPGTVQTDIQSILTSVQLIDDAIYTDGTGTPSKGMMVMGTDGTNPQNISVDTDGKLNVNVSSGSITANIEGDYVDDAAFATGADRGLIVGGVFTTDPVNSGDFGAFKMNANREQMVECIQDTAADLNMTEANSAAIKTAVELIDNAISGSEMQVDIVTMPEVTATDLDIRDLSHTQDSVKIGDGTDFLAIDGSGHGQMDIAAISAVNTGNTGSDNFSASTVVLSTKNMNYVFDGTAWDRLRGDATDGMLVNLGSNNDVTVTSGAITETNSAGMLTALQIMDDWDEIDRCKTNSNTQDTSSNGITSEQDQDRDAGADADRGLHVSDITKVNVVTPTNVSTDYDTTSTETQTSASFDTARFRWFSLSYTLTKTGSPTDIVIQVQVSPDDSNWRDLDYNWWGDLRWDDTAVGSGIDKSHQGEIFEPYMRIKVTATGLLASTNEFHIANLKVSLKN